MHFNLDKFETSLLMVTIKTIIQAEEASRAFIVESIYHQSLACLVGVKHWFGPNNQTIVRTKNILA